MSAEVAELKAIAQGLSAIAPAKALWKLSDSDRVALGNASISVGHNVKIVKWVNQNDVLGHPKVKVFFTQGGTNSFNEVGSLLGGKACLDRSVQCVCAIHRVCWLMLINCTRCAADVARTNTTGQPSQICFQATSAVTVLYCLFQCSTVTATLEGVLLCFVVMNMQDICLAVSGLW